MRYTGQGIGHKNTREHTAAFREDVTAAYGSWVAEMDLEMVDYVEDDDGTGEDNEEEKEDESEVNEDEDDGDWEDDLSEEDGEEEQGFDENDDVLAEEDEYGYTPL